jgi:hypothetical protein
LDRGSTDGFWKLQKTENRENRRKMKQGKHRILNIFGELRMDFKYSGGEVGKGDGIVNRRHKAS